MIQSSFLWWLVMWSIFLCTCLPSVCLLWKNVCLSLLPIFNHVLLLLTCMNSLCTLGISLLLDVSFANICSLFVACLFILLTVSFREQQCLILKKSSLSVLSLMYHTFDIISKRSLPNPSSSRLFMLSYRSFMVFHLDLWSILS